MKIGVISDIHANIYGLQAVLYELREKRVELILCAGDVVGYYPFVNEVCDLVRQWEIVTVKGNHDCYVLEELPITVAQRRECSLDYTTA